MWKSSVQRHCNPAPIKAAPETAPPTNTFIPRPHARSSNPRRKILAGRVFWAQRRHSEPQEEFFAFLDRIRELGGHNTNDLSNPTITHFILALTPRYGKEVYSVEDVMGTYKSHQVIREHSKWLNPSNRTFDEDRNKLENRTKMVVRRGWLEDVITGKLGLTEEGKWGVFLKSEVDTKAGCASPVKVGIDPRIRPSTLSHSVYNRPAVQDISQFTTPAPFRIPLHAEIEPAIIKAPNSPIYRDESSPEEDSCAPSSSYIATPPSAIMSLPEIITPPLMLTSAPIPPNECPPRNHLKYISRSTHPGTQTTSGLFTPPPSASPPPGMRSPDYIMIPRSHSAGREVFVWPPSKKVVASPEYKDLPSPADEDIASPSYSPISTSSDQGTPPPLELEVTIEEPFIETEESISRGSPKIDKLDSSSPTILVQPSASRQVSLGVKRPRSPVGDLAIDRRLAKRQSLPSMQSRSTSRSESPLTPCPDEPDEEMLEEGEEDEENRQGEAFGCSEGEVNGNIEDVTIWQKEAEGKDHERYSSTGPSVPDHSNSESDSETVCGVELDEQVNKFSSCKVLNANSSMNSIDDIDLKTLDLGKLVIDCDFTDELAGLLKAWI